MPTRHVLSFGGGVNSVALMVLLFQQGLPLDEAVFADTGGEVPETYEYLKVARKYLAARGVGLTVLCKKGDSLYDTAWRRQVFPSAIWRWSTRDFKVAPIHRYYREVGGHVNQYLAIAYDEVHRVKDSRVDYVTHLHPLVDRRITRACCVEIIEKEGLPVPTRSSCFFCPFNSAERWRWIHDRHPALYEKAVALEEHSKHFPSQRLTDQAFREQSEVSLRSLGEVFAAGGQLPALAVAEQQACGGECDT